MESKDMVFSCLENDDLDIRIVESSHYKSFEFLFGQAYNMNRCYRIKKGVIDARVLLEEELRIKEQNVKERRNEVKRLNEIELQKQESMMNVGRRLNDNLDFTKQQGKSSTPRNRAQTREDTDA
ncbi:hypothetical protein Tco_1548274 [Tanacetum coccineum]